MSSSVKLGSSVKLSRNSHGGQTRCLGLKSQNKVGIVTDVTSDGVLVKIPKEDRYSLYENTELETALPLKPKPVELKTQALQLKGLNEKKPEQKPQIVNASPSELLKIELNDKLEQTQTLLKKVESDIFTPLVNEKVSLMTQLTTGKTNADKQAQIKIDKIDDLRKTLKDFIGNRNSDENSGTVNGHIKYATRIKPHYNTKPRFTKEDKELYQFIIVSLDSDLTFIKEVVNKGKKDAYIASLLLTSKISGGVRKTRKRKNKKSA